MQVKPWGDMVLVEVQNVDEWVLDSGVVLPAVAMEHHATIQYGIVKSVGPGRISKKGATIPVEGIEPGDQVVFQRYAGSGINRDGADYVFLHQPEVMAVIKYD